MLSVIGWVFPILSGCYSHSLLHMEEWEKEEVWRRGYSPLGRTSTFAGQPRTRPPQGPNAVNSAGPRPGPAAIRPAGSPRLCGPCWRAREACNGSTLNDKHCLHPRPGPQACRGSVRSGQLYSFSDVLNFLSVVSREHPSDDHSNKRDGQPTRHRPLLGAVATYLEGFAYFPG